MAKTRRILLALALCATMLFGAFEAELANFDKNFAISNEKLKFHHQLTSLYIQSMMNDDDEGKKELLKRLIISSKALNLDASTYENELKTLSEKGKATPKPLFVLRSLKTQNGVSLMLSENLAQKDLRISELKEKGNNRYIIDFDASLDGGRKEFAFDNAQILLAQFDKKTTRLVLHSKDELQYSLQSKDGVLNLSFTPPKTTPKLNPNADPNQTIKPAQKPAPANVAKTTTPKKPAQSTQKPATKDTLYILKSQKRQNGVELTLSDEIDENEIRQIHMRDKGIYRIVLSFEAALDGGRKQFSFGSDTVTLTQYSAKVVRVVFNSKSEFKISKESAGKRLFLAFEKENAPANSTKSKPNSSANAQKNNAKAPKNSSKPINTKNKIIVIDAGHGGKDGGAVGNGGKWVEKDIVLSVSLKIGDELKKKGYKVFYTRTTDKFINLRDRTKLANDKKANLFVSIHANAAINATKAKTMQGIETFFLSPARSERSKEVAEQENKADFEEANFFLKQNFLSALSREKIIASNRLAIDIQKNILSSVRKKYKVVDGAVREAPFWVLVGAQDMPAVLIEIGYISHAEEGKRLLNKAYQELLAQGIARGIEAYFRNNANE